MELLRRSEHQVNPDPEIPIHENKADQTLAVASALLLASCAAKMANDPTAPSGPPDATVSLDIAQPSYSYFASSGGGGLGARTINVTGRASGLPTNYGTDKFIIELR
jgi:hypothetical protein